MDIGPVNLGLVLVCARVLCCHRSCLRYILTTLAIVQTREWFIHYILYADDIISLAPSVICYVIKDCHYLDIASTKGTVQRIRQRTLTEKNNSGKQVWVTKPRIPATNSIFLRSILHGLKWMLSALLKYQHLMILCQNLLADFLGPSCRTAHRLKQQQRCQVVRL